MPSTRRNEPPEGDFIVMLYMSSSLIRLAGVYTMADTYGDLDWRDNPKASPSSGSILHSRQGKNGDFHVVLPFPGGGLVHWFRDNFRNDLPWHTAKMFGDGDYVGASICETDYASHPPTTIKNLDVVAVTKDGRVEVWTRECGGDYRWSLLIELTAGDGAGAPSLAYTGACFKQGLLDQDLESHGRGSNFIAYPSRAAGVQFWWCRNNDKDRSWWDIRILFRLTDGAEVRISDYDPRPVTAVAATLIADRQDALWSPSWKELNSGNAWVSPSSIVFATVFVDGGISVFEGGMGKYGVELDGDFVHHLTIYTMAQLSRPLPGGGLDSTPVRGRPGLLQSEYLLQEKPPSIVPLVLAKSPQVGDLVVMAPGKNGGILFWVKNFGDYNDPTDFKDGWNYQYQIGNELYDDVSVVQANFLKEGNKYHNLEITARRFDLEGFHQYWCDWKGNWGGPIHVLGEVTKTIQQAVTPETKLSDRVIAKPVVGNPVPSDPVVALAKLGVDYSVSEQELREWLANAQYTSYPALAQALAAVIKPRRLVRAVQIDVVHGFYETGEVESPRMLADVDLGRLRRATVSAYNERYGASETDIESLMIG
jgi:hypothetical protein